MIGFSGGGIFSILPQYLSEIAKDSIRGVLGSTMVLVYNIGICLGFVIGNYCNYYTTPKVVILLDIVFLCAFHYFPESPSFLMKQRRLSVSKQLRFKNKIKSINKKLNFKQQAENSIRFYQRIRQRKTDRELLECEMNKLKNACYSKSSEADGLTLSDFKSSEARKAIFIGAVVALLCQLCGSFAMLNYTATIFKESGSSMAPNMSAIVVGAIQIVGSYCSTVLVDRAGRKVSSFLIR